MKKKIIMLALIVVTITTGIFATPIKNDVSSQVLNAFSVKFKGAQDVIWNKTADYIKASFKMDDQVLFAFYNESGELLGVSRNLLSNQLPINLNNELKKIAGDGWVIELFEFSDNFETSYYATVETADRKIKLKNIGFNEWSVIKKSKKN